MPQKCFHKPFTFGVYLLFSKSYSLANNVNGVFHFDTKYSYSVLVFCKLLYFIFATFLTNFFLLYRFFLQVKSIKYTVKQ
jgi:hypothetical protein